MNSEIALHIDSLTIEFEKVLFEDTGLEILKDELVILKGESGLGKSSLFNAILGLIEIKKGNIKVYGLDLSSDTISDIRKRIAWLPNSLEGIGQGKVNDFIRSLIGDIDISSDLKDLNLDPKLLESDFDNLSAGEKQRIGLIICKAMNKDLVLLDEPTSNLDEMNIGLVNEYISKMNSTTFMISHNDSLIEKADRVYGIINKKIEKIK